MGDPQFTPGWAALASFTGIATFKNGVNVREAAAAVTGGYFMLETDCPFLAPVPRRGKRNEPAFVAAVAERVAALRGESLQAVARQSTSNACALFGAALHNV